MSPYEPEILPEDYQRARRKVRRRPAFLLRRRDAAITGRRPRPSIRELAELRAIRQELRVRSVRPAPMRWWFAS